MLLLKDIATPVSLPPLSLYLKLVKKKDREFFILYIRWLVLLAKRGFHQKHLHENTFNLLYRAVSKNWQQTRLLGTLQQEFIARNLSLSLLLEPIDGFNWLSKNRYELSFDGASAMLLQIVAPISRMITMLNNQRPPLYQPLSSLMFAYASLYILQMPELWEHLKASCLVVNEQKISFKLNMLFKEAQQGLSVTTFSMFKFKMAFFLGLCHLLIKKNHKKSIKKMNFLEYVNAFLYGLSYITIIRDRTQGLNKL